MVITLISCLVSIFLVYKVYVWNIGLHLIFKDSSRSISDNRWSFTHLIQIFDNMRLNLWLIIRLHHLFPKAISVLKILTLPNLLFSISIQVTTCSRLQIKHFLVTQNRCYLPDHLFIKGLVLWYDRFKVIQLNCLRYFLFSFPCVLNLLRQCLVAFEVVLDVI